MDNFADNIVKMAYPEGDMPKWVDKDIFYKEKKDYVLEKLKIYHKEKVLEPFIYLLEANFFNPFKSPIFEHEDRLEEVPPEVISLFQPVMDIKKVKAKKTKVETKSSKDDKYKRFITLKFEREITRFLKDGTSIREDTINKFLAKYVDLINEKVDVMYEDYKKELETLKNESNEAYESYILEPECKIYLEAEKTKKRSLKAKNSAPTKIKEDYELKTVKTLKNICKQRKINIKGNEKKSLIIEKIIEHEK